MYPSVVSTGLATLITVISPHISKPSVSTLTKHVENWNPDLQGKKRKHETMTTRVNMIYRDHVDHLSSTK